MRQPINLLRIEDKQLRTMMDDPRLQSLLPCLHGAAKQLGSIKPGGANCELCQQRKNDIKSRAMAQARQCVANARGARLRALKEALNARQLRLVTRRPNGRSVEVTL